MNCAPCRRRSRTATRAIPRPLSSRSRPRARSTTANIACKVETGRALAVAGLHPATGGSGWSFAPATCCWRRWLPAPASRSRRWRPRSIFKLKSGKVSAEGDLDFRGTLGVAKDAPVGFAQIRLRFDVDTDAAAGQARPAAQADRALLRGLSDHQERPAGRGEDGAGIADAVVPGLVPGHPRLCT